MKVRFYGWEGGRYGRGKSKTVTLKEGNINKTHYGGFKLFDSEEEANTHYKDSKAEAERILSEHATIVRAHLIAIEKSGVDFGVWVRVADDYSLDYGHMVSVTINNFYFEKEL